VYRRITRCSSIEMLTELTQDCTDAFGEPPRQMLVFLALTEMRILSGNYGIESIIRKDPDVVLTVRDAARCQVALTGAPGRLTVLDDKTIYLRMPATYLDPEVCLFVLRNLLRAAYEKELKATQTDTISIPNPVPLPAPIGLTKGR